MVSIKNDRLKKKLVSAYFRKEEAVVSNEWQKKVMTEIRKIGPLNGKESLFALFDQWVWRFAPAACVLIVILTAYVVISGFISEYDISLLFVNDPIDLAMVQLFDLM